MSCYVVGYGNYYDTYGIKVSFDHNLDNTREKIDYPTCKENGKISTICSVCGEVLATETISAKGHDWGIWKTTKEPTWKDEGIKTRICDVCGEIENRSLDVLPYVDVADISLNKSNLDMEVGDTVELTATIKPDNASEKYIIWASSNEGVAKIDKNGFVTAVWGGHAIITATSNNGKSSTCEIDVKMPADAVEFTSLKTTSIAVGETLSLKATAICEDGQKPYKSDVVFEIVKGEEFATIDSKGKFIAKAAGEVVVRATAVMGTEDAYADITINICIPAKKVTFNTTKAAMIVGGTLKLSATMSPANNTDTLTWSVDKPEIATVDENGTVTALKAGSVKVTATSGSGKTATCSVTVGAPADTVKFNSVKSTSLAVGKTLTLTAKASCEDGTKPVSTAVTYEIVSGEECATIDANGKLKGVATGEVVVRATAVSGTDDAFAEIAINVCVPITKIKFSQSKLTLYVGDEAELLIPTVTPLDNRILQFK